MGRIESAMHTLLDNQERSRSEGLVSREDTGMTSLPPTIEGGHSRQTPPVVTQPRRNHGCGYMAFTSCKPPTYKGEQVPVLATRWVREMELAFDTCKCAEEDKVIYALSMLKGDAIYWWDAETRGASSAIAKATSWERFVARFRAQFCPLAAVKKLEEEFLQLQQGNMTVREYTSRFIEKPKFSEIYTPTEERRIERYIYGLKGNIREFVMTKDPVMFQAVVDAAKMIEKDKTHWLSERMGDKRKWEGLMEDSRKPKTARPKYRGNQGYGERPCGKCRKVHQGDCHQNLLSCFRCWKPGHISRDCPTGWSCFQCGSLNHIKTDYP